MEGKRRLGIGGVAEIPWGTHCCHFYTDKTDFIDTMIAYFEAGLENNEFCMWITSKMITEQEAKIAMSKHIVAFQSRCDKGQIEIIPYDKWYLEDGVFDTARVLVAWNAKLKFTRENSYDGMRVAGSTDWVEEKYWEQISEYESEMNNVIATKKMLAICNYSLSDCTAAAVADAILSHQFTIINKAGRNRIISDSNSGAVVDSLRREIRELEVDRKLFVGRELKMIELKKEIERLNEELDK